MNNRSFEHKKHHDKCREIFNAACSPGTDVWVHLDEINDDENMYLSFSIITEDIIRYDAESRNQPGYRPYFMSFIARKTENAIRFVRNNAEILNYGDGGSATGWFSAVISDTYNNRNNDATYEFDGQTEFCASPVEYKYKHLIITSKRVPKSILDKINTTYCVTTKSDTDIVNLMNPILNGVTLEEARVYRVGHGNLIRFLGQGTGKKSFSMLYDVGYHRGSHPVGRANKYCTLGRILLNVDLRLVVLSHWDADHIMGIAYAPDKVFDVPWVAPDVSDCSLNARRLACFLDYKKKLNLVQKNQNPRTVFVSGFLELAMGKNKSVDDVSRANSSGLVIAYRTSKTNSIFCGDVPYKALVPIASGIWNYEYKNIVVPHHAREMDAGSLKPVILRGRAIYCNNRDMDNGHTDELKRKNYELKKTEDARNYYSLKLN